MVGLRRLKPYTITGECLSSDGAWVEKGDEVFGEDSRCIEHASGVRPLCLKHVCGQYGNEAGKASFAVCFT